MSGHNLTKDFTPEQRQQIEAMKVDLRADILSRLAENQPRGNARDALRDTLASESDPS